MTAFSILIHLRDINDDLADPRHQDM